MVKYDLKTTKTILNRLKYIDSWFWCRYTLNPYNGCEHACVYCDARSDRYYLHKDFEETVYAKQNAVELLEQKITGTRTWLPDVVAIGGTCDAYQPAEKDFQITRQILKVLLKHKYPVCLSTKNALILRDGPILEQIANATFAAVAFTITSIDPDIVSFLEPKAASTAERLAAIRQLREKFPKIIVGVNFMPIVPLLEDNPENLEGVIKGAKEAGAQYVCFAPGVTLRDSQAAFFFKALQTYATKIGKPSLFDELYTQFGTENPNKYEYFQKITAKILMYCKKFSLPTRAPRWYPPDFRSNNYRAAEILLNDAYNNQIAGKPYKTELWAGFAIQNLEESLDDLAARDELKTVKNMTSAILERINPFIKKPNTLTNFMSKKKKL